MMTLTQRICPECGQEFEPNSSTQRYCSTKCGEKYRAVHGPNKIYPSITFTCAYAKCGRTVVTDGKNDRRTRFCSPECEKRYWRHPPYEHESARQNFRTFEEYMGYERRETRE